MSICCTITNDTLQCDCSLITSIYDQYLTIEPIHHQVILLKRVRVSIRSCNRFVLVPFASDEWRTNITSEHSFPISLVYTRNDYRRFLSAHLQFLAGLCYLTNQTTRALTNQLLSSLFISAQLLSTSLFHARLNTQC